MSSSLVTIPAGSINLSDRRTSRTWEVSVAAFEMSVHPVTRQEYAEALGEPAPPATEWSAAHERPSDGLPATDLSWRDAVEHCNRLSAQVGLSPAYEIRPGRPDAAAAGRRAASPGSPEPQVIWDRAADGYRLPTEAEWELSCRAGTAGPRYGELEEIAWFRDNSGERPHPVGLKAPNAFGLHDMLGNVWEWCWDVYDAEVYGAYRVLRGGGWFDEHWSCRASVRRRSHPSLRLDDVGFRIARGPVPA